MFQLSDCLVISLATRINWGQEDIEEKQKWLMRETRSSGIIKRRKEINGVAEISVQKRRSTKRDK